MPLSCKNTQQCLVIGRRECVASWKWVSASMSSNLPVVEKLGVLALENRKTMMVTQKLSRGAMRCVIVSLTFQSQLSESPVSAGLQQLPNDPVRLLKVPLHHRHPPPVPRQDGCHGWAQDAAPNYHHIRLRGHWGLWGGLWGRGLYNLPFSRSVTLRSKRGGENPLTVNGNSNTSAPQGKYLKHTSSNNLGFNTNAL